MARPPIDAPRRRTRPTGTPVEAAAVPALLPDEDPADFQALHAALRAELAPRTPYQTRLADNLVELEWEMRRHRRLIAGALRRGFRAQAAVAIRGTPVTLTRASIDPEEREAMQWAAALTMIPPERANEIEQVLEERGVTRSEIVAAAYAADPVIGDPRGADRRSRAPAPTSSAGLPGTARAAAPQCARCRGAALMATPRQIAANRRNGARGRGPVTAVGRARAAQNARRHGLAAPPDPDAILAFFRLILDDPAAEPDLTGTVPRLQAALALALAEARLARVRCEETVLLARRTPVPPARQRLLLRYRREAEAGRRRALRAWIAVERRIGSTAPTPHFPETNPISCMR